MKRYFKEFAGDLERKVNKEMEAGEIPTQELLELDQAIAKIMSGLHYGLITEKEVIADLLDIWNALDSRKMQYSSEYITLKAANWLSEPDQP